MDHQITPKTLDNAVKEFIMVASKWTEWASNREIFAQVWPESETPDWNDKLRMYNHFFAKINNECRADGYLFLISLDNNNLQRASLAVLPRSDIKDIILAKNFALYFNMRTPKGDFITKYNALNENSRNEILQEYIDQGYHLYY